MIAMKRADTIHRSQVWFITLALIGLTVLQFFLLRFAWELKNQAFVRNVNTALTVTAANLETEEIFDGAVHMLMLTGDGEYSVTQTQRFIKIGSSRMPAPRMEYRPFSRGIIHADTLETPDAAYCWSFEHGVRDSGFIEIDTDFVGATDALSVIVQGERTDLIHRIVGDLVQFEARPIKDRIEKARLDSLLTANLGAVGVDVVPEYGVMEAGRDTLVYTSGQGRPDDLTDSEFKTRLFPLDLAPPHYDLALHFPGEQVYLAGQIWPFSLASIVFMSVIVAGFVRTLRANAAQRRYAEHLVDFVNNMTHEFKTPISTVSLASEALAHDDITDRPDALRRYNAMIREENRRMGDQVEKILQIAQLESGDFELNRSCVDLNELTASVTRSCALRVERQAGSLDFQPYIEPVRVSGDEVHLASVIDNLVDNAIKYAAGAPEITVSTRRDGETIILEVADRGPGIADKDLGQVFEKYFRGHTGNRHDVKGFGLGLSYVKLVIEAHGGRVKLAARTGGGAVATIRLPRLPAEQDPTKETAS